MANMTENKFLITNNYSYNEQNDRIIESSDPLGHQVQFPCNKHGCLQLEQVEVKNFSP